jgi:hypothetical protein
VGLPRGCCNPTKQNILPISLFVCFLVVLGLELRVYTLSHSTSPFCDGFFRDRVSRTRTRSSRVARIIGSGRLLLQFFKLLASFSNSILSFYGTPNMNWFDIIKTESLFFLSHIVNCKVLILRKPTPPSFFPASPGGKVPLAIILMASPP